MPANFVPPAGIPTSVIHGSNEDVQPETSRSANIGIVLTPSWLKNFSLSVDYYRVELEDAIAPADPVFIMQQCYLSGATLSSPYCSMVTRNPDGTLNQVLNPYTNIGRLETDGFDFSLRYRLALSDLGLDDAGSLAFSIQGNYIDDFHRQNQPGSPIVQYAGRLETGPENGLFPRLRTNLTTTYARDSWSLGWTVRMSSRVRVLESQITTVGGIDKYAEIGERTITTPSDNSSCRRPLETCGSRPASRTSSTKRPRSPSREGDSAWGSDSEPHAPACEITPASCQLESASRDACDPAR